MNPPARARVRFSGKPGASAQRLIVQCEKLVGLGLDRGPIASRLRTILISSRG